MSILECAIGQFQHNTHNFLKIPTISIMFGNAIMTKEKKIDDLRVACHLIIDGNELVFW